VKTVTGFVKGVCFFLCASLLSSCGLIIINYPDKTEAETEAVTEAESETAEETQGYTVIERDSATKSREYLKTIEDEDFGGAIIKIASVNSMLTDDKEGVQVISKAVARRNQTVEDKLGIEIVSTSTDAIELFSELSASAKSGMPYADLIMVTQGSLASFAQSGLLFNLRSIPDMDLDKPYFNQSAVGAASVGYSAYAVAGDATVTPYSLYAMYVATDRLKSLGLSAPYDIAKNGKWTWDEYYRLTTDVGDFYKLTLGDCGDASVDAAYYSVGGSFISAGLLKTPTVAVTTETAEPLCSIISAAFNDEKSITNEWGNSQTFKDGAVFMIDTLGRMENIYQNGFRFGILPLPKASEDSEYITLSSEDSLFLAVPSTLSFDERIAVVLSTFCAASADRIPVAFKEYAQNTMIQDNGSGIMLDLIMDNIKYDFLHTAMSLYPEAQNASNYCIRNVILYGEDLTYLLDRTVPQAESILKEAYPMG